MLNRADAWDDTGHPYANGASRTMVDQDFKLLGMKLDARAHFNQLDTEAACGGGLWDWAVVKDGVSGAEVTPRAGGVKQGDAWTAWGHVPSGQVAVYFSSDNINCAPGDCSCQNGTTYPYSGAALKEVELRRYQSTNWYFPPLRFPGQYFDAETDLHENWNRFYDPQTGRYWQQEPYLREPLRVGMTAQRAELTASYAYAGGDPVAHVDPNGLDRLRAPQGSSPPAGYEGGLPLPEFPSRTPPPGPQLPEFEPPQPNSCRSPRAQLSPKLCTFMASLLFAYCMKQGHGFAYCTERSADWLAKCIGDSPLPPN